MFLRFKLHMLCAWTFFYLIVPPFYSSLWMWVSTDFKAATPCWYFIVVGPNILFMVGVFPWLLFCLREGSHGCLQLKKCGCISDFINLDPDTPVFCVNLLKKYQQNWCKCFFFKVSTINLLCLMLLVHILSC